MNSKIEEIKKAFNGLVLDEENFEYKVMTSTTSPEFYIYYDDDKIIDAHLKHIISDMRDDDWFLVACVGELSGSVKGTFLFQRAKVRH